MFPVYAADRLKQLFPQRPILIGCPPTLLDQWERELHKYLAPQRYDIFVITQTAKTRKWASLIAEKSKQPKHRQIYLVSHTVSKTASDFKGFLMNTFP